MLSNRDYYEREGKDTCDICDEQRAYVFALGLTLARISVGR